MLSKYTGVFVGIGVLLGCCCTNLATASAFAAPLDRGSVWAGNVTPVVLWNYQHQWASFRFQFLDRAKPFTQELVVAPLVGTFPHCRWRPSRRHS